MTTTSSRLTNEDAADWLAITAQARDCRARGDLDAAAVWTEMADELLDSIGTRDCD
jgi:hypothetical protein